MKTSPLRTVKTLIGLSGLLLLAAGARAQFTFPVYEPFAYPETNRLGDASGLNWNNGSSTGASSPITTTNASLSFPGMPADPNSPPRGLSTVPTSTSVKYRHAPFTAQNSGTVYCSFLLNIPNITNSANTIILTLSSSSSSSTVGGASVWLNPAGQLQLAKNTAVNTGPSVSYTSAATNTAALAPGNTYLVVMAYKFNTGSSSDDEVDLWLNPTSLGGSSPAPTLSVTNGTDVSSLVCLFFYQAIGNVKFYVDEIRVDNNWAGVTPVSPSPGPTFNVTGGGVGCPGSSFAVGLSGSASTNDYWLYVNSAFSGQIVSGDGSAISFGPQSVTGTYSVVASNTVNGNLGWMSGSASITVSASPSIVTQPAAAVVATNAVGLFSVVATGDGLAYQWYKNGVGLTDSGHISGSHTANLIISPATTADAATAANGYYVIITNNCGYSVTSITNGLTLDQAANLTWIGNGAVNNLWDVSTTANWNNGVTTVAFNSGDNVTFDDSATTNAVNLANSHLAPGNIHVNSSFNYTFTGSGAIVGTSSLIKDSSGTLTNRVVNSYTGGTIINSGTINIATPAAAVGLGSGTVTLAGGTLQFGTGLGFNGPNIGFNNNINVTAPSTIEMDNTGSQACVLLEALTGTSGTTLTISEPSQSAVGRFRMYGAFTNSLNIVLSSGGPGQGQQTTLQFASYNTNGSQVFNGIISGDGQIIARNNADGDVIFNGQNTFQGYQPFGSSMSFVLSTGGNVGIGVDSDVSLASGPLGTGELILTAETSSTASSGSGTLFASGGVHTLHNPMQFLQGTNWFTFIIGGSNNLTLAGTLNLVALDGTFTNRIIRVDNTALTTMSGVIDDAGLGCPVTKSGTGTLALSAVNTYAGPTTVSNGTLLVNGQIGTNTVTVAGGRLGGSGTILGPVTVSSGGTLAPGTNGAVSTLTINNDLTLNGNLFFKINKSLSPSQSNDVASVSGTLANGGTGALTVTNLGSALAVGNKFYLFNKAVANGSTLGVSGGGVLWINNLQVDGSITVTSGTVPTPVINSVILQNGTNLVFSGTNGVGSGSYSILSSTNVTTPLANWVLQASGSFTGTGAFNYTNTIGTNVITRFFILRIP